VKKRPEHVPPGEWGNRVVFFKPVEKVKKNEDGDEEQDRWLVLREYCVFNAEQCEGPGIEKLLAQPGTARQRFIDYRPAEEVIAATKADIRFGGGRPFYSPQGDFIQLPPKETFVAPHEFYAVKAHECCHWTGHRSRLNRLDKLARFGDESYAVEELVAELGSAFLMAELGIPQSDDLSNVTAYLADWLRVLEGNHSAVFTASAAASRAVEYIWSFSRPAATEPEAGEALAPVACAG
jgi:antirestriction protein ArdC